MTLTYDPAIRGEWTGTIPPGTRNFKVEVARVFGYPRAEIVRDKSRCMSQSSEHCSCRACDFFTSNYQKGRLLFDWAVENADALGIQSVIFWRRVWGFGHWYERHYNGPSPHTDHVHIGLTRDAAKTLTVAKIKLYLPGGGGSQEDDVRPEDIKAIAEAVRDVELRDRVGHKPSTLGEILQFAHMDANGAMHEGRDNRERLVEAIRLAIEESPHGENAAIIASRALVYYRMLATGS